LLGVVVAAMALEAVVAQEDIDPQLWAKVLEVAQVPKAQLLFQQRKQ
jgi:hypothetical protein